MHIAKYMNRIFWLVCVLLTTYHSRLSAATTDTTALAGRDLKILSWNIYLLPGIAPVAGRTVRAAAIADTISKLDYDIIVFQEAFHKKAVKAMREKLKSTYPFMYGPYNQPKSKVRVNSGVWIISKLPLKELGTTQFSNGKVADKFALKGAALLEGTVGKQTFQILGTHLQAEDKFNHIRREQFTQIYTKLLKVYQKEGVPQIICGDMNTQLSEQEEYNFMLKAFDAENGFVSRAQQHTYDGTTNRLAASVWKHAATTLDYILLRKNGLPVKAAYRYISTLRKEWKKGKFDLSDHYGVVLEIKF